VLDALSNHTEPVTADELAAALPHVHVSSVYRALSVLEDEGVISHVHLGHGPAVYQLAETAGVVRHLVCDACGRHVVVPAALFDPLRRRLEREYDFLLDAGHFAVVGRCRWCAGSAGPPGDAHR
jgi:Fur family transcriptional regulator, ferric uptake regulator